MENLENLSLADLRAYAKKLGMKGVSTLRKKELAQRLSQEQQKHTMSEATASIEKQSHDEKKERRQNETAPRRDGREFRREYNQKVKAHYNNNASAETESGKIRNVSHDTEAHTQRSGILEVLQEGYGFIRCENFLPGEDDVYVSPALIRKYQLRTGDILTGVARQKSQNEKFGALLYIADVNGHPVAELARRKKFEHLTPIFPNERIRLETPGSGISMRMMDLISPIGKGQRGMIVSQPKTGKTTLLKQVAKAVKTNHPKMHIIVLLIDERPEEVTDM